MFYDTVINTVEVVLPELFATHKCFQFCKILACCCRFLNIQFCIFHGECYGACGKTVGKNILLIQAILLSSDVNISNIFSGS